MLDLGHLRTLLSRGPLDAYLDWALEEQRDFVVWCGTTPRVVVIEPESIRAVLLGDDFVRNTDATTELFGHGLVGIDGEPWRRRRAMLAPTLRGEALASAVDVVQDEVGKLIASWRARGPVAFRPTRELSACMLQVLGRVLFGFRFDPARHGGTRLHRALVTLSSNAVEQHFLSGALSGALPGALSGALSGALLSLRNARAVAAARALLDDMCAEILRDGDDTAFMSALRAGLRAGELEHQTVIDELRTFLIAGHETSATAGAWALALVAEHGALARPLIDEGRRAASMTTQAELLELDASTRWIKETLRLYSTVPLATAQPVRDLTLGRLELPRGTHVDVATYVQHRLPWLWAEPERFDPTRFEQPPRFGSYLPFLLGPHTCIGMQLAMIELPLLVSRVAASFSLELPEGPPRPNMRVSLHPAGLVMCARPRAPQAVSMLPRLRAS